MVEDKDNKAEQHQETQIISYAEETAENVPGDIAEKSIDWAVLAHCIGVCGILFPIVFNIAAPMLVWFFKSDNDEYVRAHAKEAVNFQITVSLMLLVLLPLSGIPLLGIIFFIVLLFFLFWVAYQMIVAALAAKREKTHRYPMTLRLL